MRPRLLLSLLVLALLVVLGAMWLLSGNLDRLVGRMIQDAVSEATGTPVTLRSVRLSLREGRVILHGLRIGNPDGYRQPDALLIERIEVQLDPSAQSRSLVRVNSAGLEGLTVTFEAAGSRTNLQDLLDRMRTRRGADDTGREPVELVIDELVAEGGEVLVWLESAAQEPRRIVLPTIRLRGIGERPGSRQAGDVAAQVLAEIFQQALARGAEAALRELVDQAGQRLGEELRESGQEAGRRLLELLEER